MKTIFYFLLFILIIPCQIKAEDTSQPLRVIIVGAGPAGLGAAIEAHLQGADVTVIEKREAYTRVQTLFLLDSSVQLLEKWKVTPTQMKVISLPNARMAVVKINNLEEGLEKRVHELGIRKLTGDFLRFSKDSDKSIQILHQDKEISVSYDILVGADGAHSLVRDQLGIKCNLMGKVQGIAFMTLSDQPEAPTITEPIKKNGFFVKKIGFPPASIIFTQRIPGSNENEPISEKELEELMKACDFKKEAELIAEKKAKIGNNIEVILQQTKTFSDEKKGVILIGDAVAVASFFQGMGANYAFKEVMIASDFFEKVKKHDPDAYSSFNHIMKETSDELINDSKFLFYPETASKF
jgi:2-polyprenyl-6-methoxyphenol hydroxylase-like FAD-dependent oxidoreductase